MTDEHDDDAISEAALAEQEQAMRTLLAKAGKSGGESGGEGGGDEAPHDPARSELVLRGVQRKIRERSRGKFFGDGWSTSPSRTSYGLVALVMLLILAVAYFALSPTALSG